MKKLLVTIDEPEMAQLLADKKMVETKTTVYGLQPIIESHSYYLKVWYHFGVGAPAATILSEDDIGHLLEFREPTYILCITHDTGSGDVGLHLASNQEPRIIASGAPIPGAAYKAIPSETLSQWRSRGTMLTRYVPKTKYVAKEPEIHTENDSFVPGTESSEPFKWPAGVPGQQP